jgi:hypothetical protein
MGVDGFDERLTDALLVLIAEGWVFTEFGDGDRRLFIVDCGGVGNVFGTTSVSYSGIGSIWRLNCRGNVES